MEKRSRLITWTTGTILGSLLAAVMLVEALRCEGVERVIFDRGGVGWISVRPLPGPEWRVPAGGYSQQCGVTDWGTRYTDIRCSYYRGSVEVLEDCVYFLRPSRG
jgi:hypothetical protein